VAWREIRRFHLCPHKVVELRSWVRQTQRRNSQCQHLKCLHACARHRKCEHVFPRPKRMIFLQTFDVSGIVEKPFALGLNKTGVVLAVTLQASALNRGGLSFPVGCDQFSEAIGSDSNSSVDDWYQMRIGNQVQGVAPPGAIHA